MVKAPGPGKKSSTKPKAKSPKPPIMLMIRWLVAMTRALVPGDSAALAATLAQLLGSPDIAAKLAVAARQRVAEFDSRALLPRHVELLRSLTATPR